MSQVIVFDPKQVSEEVDLTFDFSKQMAEGETLTGIVGTITAVAAGDIVSADAVTLSDQIFDADGMVRVIASGGSHGERYLVTVKVAGTRQPVLELEAYLPVRNRP